MMPVCCIIFPKGKASVLNETLRRGSSEAHHGLGCLSPCQDTFVQLFFSVSISPMHKSIWSKSHEIGRLWLYCRATSWRLVQMKANESLKEYHLRDALEVKQNIHNKMVCYLLCWILWAACWVPPKSRPKWGNSVGKCSLESQTWLN